MGMKKILLLPMLTLAACGPYQPKVVGSVDAHKYESDLAECVKYAQNVDTTKASAYGAFGLVGYAASHAIEDKNDPMFKSGKDNVDECMLGKGYKLIK